MAVVLDSAAIVSFLDRDDALHSAADAAIRELMTGHRFYASAVTFAEVMTGARLAYRDEDAVRGFFAGLVAEILPVDESCADRASRLRADHRSLRMPDALILAAAASHPEVEVLLTGDAAMANVDGLSFRVELLRPPA